MVLIFNFIVFAIICQKNENDQIKCLESRMDDEFKNQNGNFDLKIEKLSKEFTSNLDRIEQTVVMMHKLLDHNTETKELVLSLKSKLNSFDTFIKE